MIYRDRLAHLSYTCQSVVYSTLLVERDIKTQRSPEADEHRYEKNGVFYLAIDCEVFPGSKNKADDESDRYRYLCAVAINLYPDRTENYIKYEFQQKDAVEFLRLLFRFFVFRFSHKRYYIPSRFAD